MAKKVLVCQKKVHEHMNDLASSGKTSFFGS